jgi:hypothetical protein
MAAFVGRCVPVGQVFVIGEGGECVRDFFRAGVATLREQYMTPADSLAATLNLPLDGYPDRFLPQNDDPLFPLRFYRFQRMPGNFSQRHAVLSVLRPKISPFLDGAFMEGSWALAPEWHRDSRLHRSLVAHLAPELLPFFDDPIQTPVTTQEWPVRFSSGIGEEVRRLLEESLPFASDVFRSAGVLDLCEEAIRKPSRAIYHLLRLLSFALGRQALRNETDSAIAAERQVALRR